MLLNRATLDGIRRGEITLAFRRWRRPTVRSGGTLLTAAGQLQIRDIAAVSPADITEGDARRAGHASKAALLAALERRPDGEVYRIAFGALLPDPRVALREEAVAENELPALRRRLDLFDAAAADGAWTLRTLRLLRARPGVRAGDLCAQVGQERTSFKRNVRKLKALGLTESLGTGYRLSPRGESLLDATSAPEV